LTYIVKSTKSLWYLYVQTLFMNKKNIDIYEINFKIKKPDNFKYEIVKAIKLYIFNEL